MPYQMNPGVLRTCSECNQTFLARIANNLTCSPRCALFRKTACSGRDGDRAVQTASQYCGPAVLIRSDLATELRGCPVTFVASLPGASRREHLTEHPSTKRS
jgi:hypothetical protein